MIDYIPIILVWAGTVIFMDGLFSIILYLGEPSWRGGEAQSWRKDHLVRLVRCAIALVVTGIGVLMV
jgi:hypothetical protein